MIIKEELSEQDNIDISLELYELVGMTKKKLKKARAVWILNLVLGITMLVLGYSFYKNDQSDHLFFAIFFLLLGTFYFFRSVFAIIFLKKSYKARLIKSLKKYNATTRQRYNINDTYEVTTEIKDGYIETSSLGIITKYSLNDYVKKLENEKFYIFEFTNGRYIFFKKETFKDADQYNELVKEIEQK